LAGTSSNMSSIDVKIARDIATMKAPRLMNQT